MCPSLCPISVADTSKGMQEGMSRTLLVLVRASTLLA